MAIEIVDFPIKNGGSFHGKMLVHQRVDQSGNAGDSEAVDVETQQDDVEIKAAAFADTCTARMPLGRKDLPPAPGLTVMDSHDMWIWVCLKMGYTLNEIAI